jgi:hypoxanthine phosphoribosyltransferase
MGTKSIALYSEREINQILDKLVNKIWSETSLKQSQQVYICVLNGAYIFFSDLTKKIDWDIEVDFIRVKSYNKEEQDSVKLLKDIELNIEGKEVFIVDELCDSGNTFKFLEEHLQQYNPLKINFISLFKKKNTNIPNLACVCELDENIQWIWGYGLDREDGTGRNLPYITGKIIEID